MQRHGDHRLTTLTYLGTYSVTGCGMSRVTIPPLAVHATRGRLRPDRPIVCRCRSLQDASHPSLDWMDSLPLASAPSDVRRVEVPDEIVVELQGLHVGLHIDRLVHRVGVLRVALPGRRPAVDVSRQTCMGAALTNGRLPSPAQASRRGWQLTQVVSGIGVARHQLANRDHLAAVERERMLDRAREYIPHCVRAG